MGLQDNIYDATRDFTEKDKARRQYQNLQENQFRKVLEQYAENNDRLNRLFVVSAICLAIAIVVTLVRIVTV